MIIQKLTLFFLVFTSAAFALAEKVELKTETNKKDNRSLKVIINEFTSSHDDEFNAFLQEKRNEMLLSVENRFLRCDKDADDTLDVYETTVCLPQVARQFRNVDINNDNLISLDELSILAKDYYLDTKQKKSAEFEPDETNRIAKENK